MDTKNILVITFISSIFLLFAIICLSLIGLSIVSYSSFLNSNIIASTFAVVSGAVLASYFGFRQYRIQKIWEKIDERYFKAGIEEYISDLQRIRRTLEHNFAYSLLVLRYYRDMDEEIFLDWFDLRQIKENNKLSSNMPSSFLATALILKNKHFNMLSHTLHARIQGINDYYISDCMIALYKIARDIKNANLSKKETADKLMEEGNQRIEKVSKELGLYVIIETLEEILFILRKQNIDSYEKLEQVHKNKDIQKLLKNLESIKLSEDLQKVKNDIEISDV